MFGHLPELIIVLVLALIFFGPEKLPQMASDAGKMVRELRQAVDGVVNNHDTELEDDDQFATYYHDALERSGEVVDPADEVVEDYESSEDEEFDTNLELEHVEHRDATHHEEPPSAGDAPAGVA